MRTLVIAWIALLWSGCVDPDCKEEFVGGGSYSITLEGELSAVIEGEGSSRREIKDWIAGGSWADVVARYVRSGETIALLGTRVSGEPPYPGFVSSKALSAGAIEGCEAARFIATFVSEDERSLDLLNANGGSLFRDTERGPQPWDWDSYDDAEGGEEGIRFARGEGACVVGDLVMSVKWSLNKRTKVRRKIDGCTSGLLQ